MCNIINVVDKIVSGGGQNVNYKAFEIIDEADINNLELLWCSIILFEQEREFKTNPAKAEEHYQFWKDTNRVKASYHEYMEHSQKDKVTGWPTSISITCTSRCNLFCKNCTHAGLVESKQIRQVDLDLDQVYYSIRKIKLLTIINSVSDREIEEFSFVGLGEPLLYPHIFEAYSYARKFFPRARMVMNTNTVLLDDSKAKQLANSSIDAVVFSLSYWDDEVYFRQTKVNCAKKVKVNIYNFLDKYYNTASKMQVIIHIFDNVKNDEANRKEFAAFFEPFIQRYKNKVFLEYRQFGNLTKDEEVNCSWLGNRENEIVPCAITIWRYLTISEEATIYPCCLALWKPQGFDEQYIRLGSIFDDLWVINSRITQLRQKQINGEYGGCLGCDELYNPVNTEYFQKLQKRMNYDKERMIKESVPYQDTKLKDRLISKVKFILKKV